jgi:hypothetical protein
MNDLLTLIGHHGYIVIFLIVLAEALGIPVPAALALVTGGAAVASGALRAPAAALVAVAEMIDRGFRAVEASLKQMKQVHSQGRFVNAMRGFSLRTIDRFPVHLKRAIMQRQ